MQGMGAVANFAELDVAILRKLAIMIDEANEGHSAGVAITGYWTERGPFLGGYYIAVMNRSNGEVEAYNVGYLFYIRYIPGEWDIGQAFGYDGKGWRFKEDFSDKWRCPYHRSCIP